MVQIELEDFCELEVKGSCVTCEFILSVTANGEMEPGMAQASKPSWHRRFDVSNAWFFKIAVSGTVFFWC